ncbi:MAG: hypothetical protein M3N46_08530 [Actinomycetota bacterium]|nr:hypothetical protein [Actinomycetota bacterium]
MSDPIELRWEALTAEFLGEPGVTLDRAFGRMSLMVDGKLFASAGPRGLLIKVSEERVGQLIRLGDAGEFRSGAGRVMREWAVATPESDWSVLAAESLAFVAEQAAATSTSD